MLGDTLLLTATGLACGIPVALASARLLAGFLYGVQPDDPLVLLGSMGFLTVTAAIAGSIPARRAARIDPMTAIRGE